MSAAPKIVLGIDPGSRITGFGVVSFTKDQPSFVEAGAIRTTSEEFNGRLQEIFIAVGAIMERVKPDEVAIEQVFVSQNAGSALKLGAARAAALCATFGSGVKVAGYSPRQIKQAVTGSGAASKDQVQQMVKMLLSQRGKLQADAADALAVAICHGNSVGMENRLARLSRQGA